MVLAMIKKDAFFAEKSAELKVGKPFKRERKVAPERINPMNGWVIHHRAANAMSCP